MKCECPFTACKYLRVPLEVLSKKPVLRCLILCDLNLATCNACINAVDTEIFNTPSHAAKAQKKLRCDDTNLDARLAAFLAGVCIFKLSNASLWSLMSRKCNYQEHFTLLPTHLLAKLYIEGSPSISPFKCILRCVDSHRTGLLLRSTSLFQQR